MKKTVGKSWLQSVKRWLIAGVIICLCLISYLKFTYNVPYSIIAQRGVRIAVSYVLQYLYSDDLKAVSIKTESYYRPDDSGSCAEKASRDENSGIAIPGFAFESRPRIVENIPFVYEQPSTPQLVTLKREFELQTGADGSGGEFEQMLQLFRWIGGLWDHGSDIPPGGYDLIDPLDILAGARQGERYWCEIAAKFTVYAATSMGWPARLVSLSRNGYAWEHAVAEIWSNEYSKWFVVDTDYNILYQRDGIPLSAYELCHYGLLVQQQGDLTVTAIAPIKPSIQMIDLIPYYAYVHIDLRNDWLSRDLAKGSPASGDLSTWWTSRPDIGPLMTIMEEVDQQELFDWPVNVVDVCIRSLNKNANGLTAVIGVEAYSPYFDYFQWSIGQESWHRMDSSTLNIAVKDGEQMLKLRAITQNGIPGPVTTLKYHYDQNVGTNE